jgi:hypothetical protein
MNAIFVRNGDDLSETPFGHNTDLYSKGAEHKVTSDAYREKPASFLAFSQSFAGITTDDGAGFQRL